MTASHLFASYNTHTVLHDISFDTKPGEILCLLGPNGSGKSTLFNILSGIKKPDSGFAAVDGIPLENWKRKELAKKIAYVPQKVHFAWECTVFEAVLMGRFSHTAWNGNYTSQDTNIVYEQLERMELLNLQNRSVYTLSGGEFQRMLLARSLAQEARVLLLDEPVSNLDITHQYALLERISQLASSGLTVIISLHDLNLAGIFAHRIVLLSKGYIHQHGDTQKVFTSEHLSHVYNMKITVVEHSIRKKPQILV